MPNYYTNFVRIVWLAVAHNVIFPYDQLPHVFHCGMPFLVEQPTRRVVIYLGQDKYEKPRTDNWIC